MAEAGCHKGLRKGPHARLVAYRPFVICAELLNVFQNLRVNFVKSQFLKDNIHQIEIQIDLEEFLAKP